MIAVLLAPAAWSQQPGLVITGLKWEPQVTATPLCSVGCLTVLGTPVRQQRLKARPGARPPFL